ncbi:hypothetical protein [Brevundimonas sp.]|uniref:hypothetical protein n=1 Tax=Brevundimonas sp. TaxID=1871086 RepID=UPI00356A45EC
MPQFGSWKPIHDTHAIQLAAITVTLNEPVGDLTFRKALNNVNPIAVELGLTEHAPINPQLPPQIQQFLNVSSPMQGMSYVRQSDGRIGERAFINRESLRFEDFEYIRWSPFKARAQKLLGDAVSEFTGGSSVNNISSEYTDVFIGLVGDQSDVSEVVNANSPLIAAGAFHSKASWHCHMGWFEPIDEHCRRLVNVNIDVADNLLEEKINRQVRIKTQTFDQFGQDGYAEYSNNVSWERLSYHLDSSHDRLKSLLRDILSPEAALAISLP